MCKDWLGGKGFRFKHCCLISSIILDSIEADIMILDRPFVVDFLNSIWVKTKSIIWFRYFSIAIINLEIGIERFSKLKVIEMCGFRIPNVRGINPSDFITLHTSSEYFGYISTIKKFLPFLLGPTVQLRKLPEEASPATSASGFQGSLGFSNQLSS